MPICEVDIPVGVPYRDLTNSVALVPLSYAKKIQQKENSLEKQSNPRRNKSEALPGHMARKLISLKFLKHPSAAINNLLGGCLPFLKYIYGLDIVRTMGCSKAP
jgi:hypothetical protein